LKALLAASLDPTALIWSGLADAGSEECSDGFLPCRQRRTGRRRAEPSTKSRGWRSGEGSEQGGRQPQSPSHRMVPFYLSG